jgi:hypothetical protein
MERGAIAALRQGSLARVRPALLALRGDARTAAAVGAAATVLLALFYAVLPHESVPHGDESIYERMAQHPFDTHTFPFAYRIAVPTLAHVLPFSHTFSFVTLALLCTGAASGFLYLVMTRLGTPPAVALALALLFAISPPLLVVVLRQGRNVDAATVLAMIAATLFILDRRPVALGVTLALGALTRESALFMVPFAYAVWATRPLDWQAARRVLLVAAPAVAAYVALRLAIPTVGRELVQGYGGSLVGDRFDIIGKGLSDWKTELRRVFIVFGPLWLLAPLALPRMSFARRGLVLVALCAVSMSFALDWGRVLLLAAPVVYPAAGYVLRERPRLQAITIASWLAVILIYAAYMGVSGVDNNINHPSPPSYPVQ